MRLFAKMDVSGIAIVSVVIVIAGKRRNSNNSVVKSGIKMNDCDGGSIVMVMVLMVVVLVVLVVVVVLMVGVHGGDSNSKGDDGNCSGTDGYACDGYCGMIVVVGRMVVVIGRMVRGIWESKIYFETTQKTMLS